MDVISIGPSMKAMAGELLARAFFDNPEFAVYFPDPEQRKKRFAGFMKFAVIYSLLYGQVFTTQNYEGSPVGFRPAQPIYPFLACFAAVIFSLFLQELVGCGWLQMVALVSLRFPT